VAEGWQADDAKTAEAHGLRVVIIAHFGGPTGWLELRAFCFRGCPALNGGCGCPYR
jgi:hypothetical protein